MTLGIIGVTRTGAISAIDSRRGVHLNDPRILEQGVVYVDVKKSFKLPGNKITIHSGELAYRVMVDVRAGKGSVRLDDPLAGIISKFPLKENEDSDLFAQRFCSYLNEHLKELLPEATTANIDKMRRVLLQEIQTFHKNPNGIRVDYSSDFNGLVQHASVFSTETRAEIDKFTACLANMNSLLGGYSGNAFELYEVETPGAVPKKLLDGKPFGFACVGEKGIAQKCLKGLDWERMSLEEATTAVVDAITQTAAQYPNVGGQISCAILKPGQPIIEKVIAPKNTTSITSHDPFSKPFDSPGQQFGLFGDPFA